MKGKKAAEKKPFYEWSEDFCKFDYAIFRVHITESLIRNQMTIKQLSEKSDVPLERVLQFFESDEKPDTEEFLHFCRALNVSADYLIGSTDNPDEIIYNPRDYFIAKKQMRLVE